MWDPIVVVADGVVVFAEWGGGYGNLVIVGHGTGWRSYYAHLEEIVVEVGQEVRQGELLGGAGSTGYSTGPHLHFELRYQGRPVDPPRPSAVGAPAKAPRSRRAWPQIQTKPPLVRRRPLFCLCLDMRYTKGAVQTHPLVRSARASMTGGGGTVQPSVLAWQRLY